MNLTKNNLIKIIIIFISTLLYFVNGRGARGGGGGSRSGQTKGSGGFRATGSNALNRGGAFANFRNGPGIRWSSFGAGFLAYSAMSNLVRSGYYRNGGYYSRSYYPTGSNSPVGELCTNKEDFNGTIFGTFRCPLPEFDPSAKYCCGPEDYQFCCRYFDDNGRRVGVIIAIVAVVAIIICTSICISRIVKRKGRFYKSEENLFMPPPTQPFNVNNINRNIYGPNPNQKQPIGPMVPIGNYPPKVNMPAPIQGRDDSNVPLMRSNTSNLNPPYPVQANMPVPGSQPTGVLISNIGPQVQQRNSLYQSNNIAQQTNNLQNNNSKTETSVPPPSYSDAIMDK